MHIIIVLIISLVGCLLLIFLLHKYLKYKNGSSIRIHNNAVYNGKELAFPLSTINAIGFNLYGNYRFDIINGSSVKYMFFCVLLPLFPVGCYRAVEGEWKRLGRQGAAQVSKTKYSIYGTEKWSLVEVLIIYLYVISIVLVFLIIYNSWDYIF